MNDLRTIIGDKVSEDALDFLNKSLTHNKSNKLQFYNEGSILVLDYKPKPPIVWDFGQVD